MYSQNTSKNGIYHTSKGTIRAFIVFAEAINDPLDLGALPIGEGMGTWEAGKMPPNLDLLIDHQFTNSSSIKGAVTKYFYDASFGNFILLGDYFPYLVRINFADISGNGYNQVMEYLNNIPANVITKNGYNLNNDFDSWTPASGGAPKINSSDDYIDMVFIYWRNNSKFRPKRDGGQISTGKREKTIKNMKGTNADSEECSGNLVRIMRHEFSHALLGDNNFHAGGAGAGVGNFLSNLGGYSILASHNSNLNTANGWDRRRLGWKPASNSYEISARSASNVEINSDFTYGQSFTNGYIDVVLRDFIKFGDAIRIELPYIQTLNSTARKQWLWIENHQIALNTSEYSLNHPKGIRINLQVGNESFTDFNTSRTNYISPINSFGNYDYDYLLSPDTRKSGTIIPEAYNYDEMSSADFVMPANSDYKYYIASTTSARVNPFTGYGLSQYHAINYADPNTTTYQNIYCGEDVLPHKFIIDGNTIFDSYTIWSNAYDAFPVGSKLNISTNPAPVTQLTYRTKYRPGPSSGYSNADTDDNRKIYLNGISIEVLSQSASGDIVVRLKWNKFDVTNDVRWCGDIVLNEKVLLASGKTITLDRSFSPTKPVMPHRIDDDFVFSDPTIFTCKSGSTLDLQGSSKIILKNSSKLIVESGATLKIATNAQIIVESGCEIDIQSGASLIKSGKIIIENKNFMFDKYIQNTVISNGITSYLSDYIFSGYCVDPQSTFGNVTLNSGAEAKYIAKKEISFEKGFEVVKGGKLDASIGTVSYNIDINNPINLGNLPKGAECFLEIDNAGKGNNYTGAFNQPSADVFYKFTVNSSATVIITTCESIISDSYIHLLTSSGLIFRSNDNTTSCSNTKSSKIETILSAGTYYLVVEGNGSSTGIIKTKIVII